MAQAPTQEANARARKVVTKAREEVAATREVATTHEVGPTHEVAPVCVHRWVIESPNGETSHGTCKFCGAEKEFPNSAEDGLWEREVPQSRWTGRSEWTPSNSGY